MRRVSLLLGSAVLSASAALADDRPIAFMNVNVIPMDTERVVPGRAVIVEGDRITSIAHAAVISLRPETRLIDGTGMYLMPGLADMHVHSWSDDEQILFLANGVTTVRNMWGTTLHLDREAAAARGDFDAPVTVTAGVLLDGEPPHWPGSTVVTDPVAARAVVREQHAAGYDFIKVYNRLKPEVYAAIVDEASRVGIPVVGHVPDAVGLGEVLNAKQSSIEHLSGYLRACVDAPPEERVLGDELIARFDPTRLDAVVDHTVAAGTWNCPTLIVLDRMRTGSDEVDALLARPGTACFSPRWTDQWRQRFATAPADRSEMQRAARDVHQQIVRALHEDGARLLLGTDTPNPFVLPGFAIHEELALLVGAGLTPFEALAAGTREAAAYLGQSRQFGTVEVGRRADLLLLRENPLEDVGHVRELAGVMTRGRWIDAGELQTRLDTSRSEMAVLERRMEFLNTLLDGEPVGSVEHRVRPLRIDGRMPGS